MNGVHDMGGMHGFGPVQREENEPVFHAPWEGRIFGITVGFGRSLRAGERFDLERLDPVKYLESSYYERWMLALENSLLESGTLTADELDARMAFFRENPDASPPQRKDPELVKRTVESLNTRYSPHREVGVAPRFRVGDVVRARNINPPGHTRLPRYVRGKQGVITRIHGVHDLQDTVGKGEPQAVYNVRFETREVWGESAEANQSLYIDMWESYLDPA